MKKKIFIYIIITIITVTLAFLVDKIINSNNVEEEKIAIADKVTDECTEEYKQLQKDQVEQTSITDEKVSPNAKFILKKYYKKCNHTIEEEIELPKEFVNKSLNEIQEEYSDWNIEEFSSDKIILSRNYDEQCNEHYILRDNDGIVAIYEVDENGNETLFDETEIATEYLTDSDLSNIKDGIRIDGKDELNKVLEDFE